MAEGAGFGEVSWRLAAGGDGWGRRQFGSLLAGLMMGGMAQRLLLFSLFSDSPCAAMVLPFSGLLLCRSLSLAARRCAYSTIFRPFLARLFTLSRNFKMPPLSRG